MQYLLRRIFQGAIVIFAALTLAFILMFVIGDPVLMYVGMDASAAVVQQYRVALGFDRPLWVQYLEFMGNALRGDFGLSYRHHSPVLRHLEDDGPAEDAARDPGSAEGEDQPPAQALSEQQHLPDVAKPMDDRHEEQRLRQRQEIREDRHLIVEVLKPVSVPTLPATWVRSAIRPMSIKASPEERSQRVCAISHSRLTRT
jgi:hypothetical protein